MPPGAPAPVITCVALGDVAADFGDGAVGRAQAHRDRLRLAVHQLPQRCRGARWTARAARRPTWPAGPATGCRGIGEAALHGFGHALAHRLGRRPADGRRALAARATATAHAAGGRRLAHGRPCARRRVRARLPAPRRTRRAGRRRAAARRPRAAGPASGRRGHRRRWPTAASSPGGVKRSAALGTRSTPSRRLTTISALAVMPGSRLWSALSTCTTTG